MLRKSNDGDTHFKMCKKIAQLTKVIYQLNTQNEDFDARIASMRSTHEAEVQTLSKGAERRIEELRKAFSEAEQKRVRDVLEFQKQCKSEVELIRERYAEKISSMTDELSACKSRFEEAVAEVRASDRSKVEDIARICATKDAEMENLVREYNERYKSMLAEQMNAKEALGEELRSLQLKHDATVAEHAVETEQFSDKLKRAGDALTHMSEDLKQWKQSSDSYEEEVKRLQQECSVLRGQLDDESDSLGLSRNLELTLRRNMEEWKQKFESAEAARASLEKIVNEKEAECAKSQSNLTDMENHMNLLNTEKNALAHQLSLATDKIERLASEVTTLEGRVNQLQAKAKEADAAASQYQESEASLKARCEELQRQISETVGRYQTELDALKSAHEKSLAGVYSASQKTTDTMLTQIRCEMNDLKGQHKEELRQLQERHKQQLKQLTDEHEISLDKLRTELDAARRISKCQQAAAEERETALATELQTEARALQAAKLQAEREAADAAGRAEAMETELKCVRDELTVSQLQVKQLLSELASSQAELASSRAELALLQSELTTTREELTRLRVGMKRGAVLAEEQEQAMRGLRVKHDETLRQREGEYERALQALQAEHEEALRRRSDEHGRALQALRAEHKRALAADGAEMRRRFEEELAAVQRVADADKQNAAEKAKELATVRREAESEALRLAGECDKLRVELCNLNDALLREKAESASMQSTLRQVQAREGELREAMRRLEERSNRSQMEVEELHRAYVDTMEQRHAQKMQAALDELRVSLTAECNAAQRRGDEALAALEKTYTDTQVEINSLKLQLEMATQKLKSRDEELFREQSNMKNAQIEFASTIDAMRHDFEEERREMRRQREFDLNEMAAKHKAFIDDLMQQHRGEQDVKDSVLQSLRAELEELRYRYEYRESRPEDVDMINRLIKEGRQKEEDLSKALNEMKMYKLELINREENYNKVFGRRPLLASNGIDGRTQK